MHRTLEHNQPELAKILQFERGLFVIIIGSILTPSYLESISASGDRPQIKISQDVQSARKFLTRSTAALFCTYCNAYLPIASRVETAQRMNQ